MNVPHLRRGVNATLSKTDWEASDKAEAPMTSLRPTGGSNTTGSEAKLPPEGGATKGVDEGASLLPGMNQTGSG